MKLIHFDDKILNHRALQTTKAPVTSSNIKITLSCLKPPNMLYVGEKPDWNFSTTNAVVVLSYKKKSALKYFKKALEK